MSDEFEEYGGLPELPVRSGYGPLKRFRLSVWSGLQYGWGEKGWRAGVAQFRGEMFRLKTDYFPGLSE
jgi:hypothetical protein